MFATYEFTLKKYTKCDSIIVCALTAHRYTKEVKTMNSEGRKYLSECIEDFLDRKDNWLAIIKQNNVTKMQMEDFEALTCDYKNYKTYYHEYMSFDMLEAYEPILSVCKDIVEKNNIDVKELLDKLDIYSLQKSVYIRYFKGEESNRDEELLVPEVEYEKQLFLEGLYLIMQELANIEPIFILLNRFNCCCTSILDLFFYFKDKDISNIKILCMSNELGTITKYVADRYSKLSRYCEKNKSVYVWPYNLIEEGVEPEKGFVFKVAETDEYTEKIITMFNTMAHDQAYNYLEVIYQKLEVEKFSATSEFTLFVMCYFAWLNIFRLNASYAMLICDSIRQIRCEGDLRDYKHYTYHYLVSNANMYNGNELEAKVSALKCLDIARKTNDEFGEFRALLLHNMAELAGWKDIWICEKEIDIPDALIRGCQKYKYFNHLAHIYIYCYDNDYRLYKVIEDISKNTPHMTLGMSMAEQMKNYQLMAEGYRKNVMISSYSGLFKSSNYFYNESIKVVKKTGNRTEEAAIYNGLGYNSSACDNYAEAHKYYQKALEIYYEYNMHDYINETLYNMGMNAILAEDYEHATEYLMAVVDMLMILKKNSIRVANISKIFGLVALSTYREGNYYLSQLYLNKARQFLEFILDYDVEEFYSYLWDDDMFLYYFVSALIDVREGRYEKAREHYIKARMFIERFSGSAFFNYPQYVMEYAKLLKIIGNEEGYKAILEEGIEKCTSMGNVLRVRQLEDMLAGREMIRFPQDMQLRTEITIEDLMEHTRRESLAIEAAGKKKDIKFFTTFQELVNHSVEDIDDYTASLLTSFKNNFNIDNVLYISCENGVECKYNDVEYPISDENINHIVEYFRDKTAGFAVSQFSNNYHDYDDIIKIFRDSKIFSIIGAPLLKDDSLVGILIAFVKIKESWNSSIDRDILDSDDMEIFEYVFRQIVDALDKYKMNQLLRKHAETDLLTGLYNRKMYYDRVEKYLAQATKKNATIDMAVIYADLDRFKYYNDTFGHSVGDAILVEFSKIFTQASECCGWVTRFGGDEFVIVLETADKEKVEKVINDIYRLIDEEDGFASVVEKAIGYPVEIKKENRASCSFGIAMQKDISDMKTVDAIRRKADDALYEVKRNGRGYAKFAD